MERTAFFLLKAVFKKRWRRLLQTHPCEREWGQRRAAGLFPASLHGPAMRAGLKLSLRS